MSLGEYLSTNYIYIGEDSDKKEFVRKLISLIYDKESKEWGNLIEALVEKREQTLTTRVSSTIAIPHAVVEGLEDNRIAVGISKQGILRGDGILMSAGTFISGDPQAEELQSGLGARHAAALGITAVTEALAIVISESTRKVSIFHGGKKIVFM